MKKSLRRASWAGAIVAVTATAVPDGPGVRRGRLRPGLERLGRLRQGNQASYQGKNYHRQVVDPEREPGHRTAASGTSGRTRAPAAAPPRRPLRPRRRRPPRPPRRPTTTPPQTGGKKVVGYFAEWGVYGRNYHVKNIAHQRLGGEADPHPVRLRQHHRRPVRDRRLLRRLRQGLHRGRQRRRRRRHLGPGALRGNFNQLRKLKRMYPNLKVHLVVRRLDLVRRLHPGRAEPDRVRRTPATTWSRTRAGPTSSTASTSTGSTRTPAA